MVDEPRRIPPPVLVKPAPGQFTGQGNSPVLQGFGMVDSHVTIRMRSGSGIGVVYEGEAVKLNLDASTLGEMPPGDEGQYWTIVYDPETGMTWRVEAVAGGAIPAHKHPESDVNGLLNDLAIRPTDAPSDDGIYGRQNGAWISMGGAVQWHDIQGKPDTFPPTLPIPMSGVVDLEATFDDVADSLQLLDDNKVDEAPTDGQQYARQNGAWASIVIPASGIPEAPNDGKQYARKSLGWSEVVIPTPAPGTVIADAPPAGAVANTMWWESDTGGLFLLYNDGNTTQWVQVNGSRDAYNPIRLNPQTITVNQSIPTGYNGMTAGPITIASGVTVDIASGSTWVIV